MLLIDCIDEYKHIFLHICLTTMSKKKDIKKTKSSSPTLEPTSEKRRNKNIILLIFLVSFLFYGNTIQNEFSMDDELVTLNHKNASKGFSGIIPIFKERYVSNDQQSYEYRPIVLVSFAIEHQFTGGDPHFSHFINIILYALTGVVLFFLLSRLFINYHWIIPVSVTFLFLIHPIHNEVVASLKNRDELLSFLFTLLSIRAFLNFVDYQKKWQILYGVLFFAISVLSKKSSLPLIVTLPLIFYYFRSLNLKKAILFVSVPILFLIVLKIYMSLFLGQTDRPGLYYENPLYVDKIGLIGKIPVIFYCIGFYIKMMFYPYPLVLYYGYSTIPIAGWGNIFAIISMVILIPLSIYCLIKIRERKLWMFGFLYFMLNAGAFSNLLPMPGIVAERFVYGASLGFFIMIVALLFDTLKIDVTKDAQIKIPQPLKYISIVIVLVYGVYIFDRNKDWHDHITTYTTDVEKAPNSAKIHALIGGYCMQELEIFRIKPEKNKLTQKQIDDYIRLSKIHFNSALEILPDYIACLNNLGTLYYSYIGKPDSAAIYFKIVTEKEPKHLQAHFNLGSYYEVENGNYNALENFAGSNMNDSLFSLEAISKEDEIKFDKFYKDIKAIFQVQKILVNEATNIIQQFINTNRQMGNANVDPAGFIDAYNKKWNSTMTQFHYQASGKLNPGKALFDYLFSDQAKDQEELIYNLGRIVNQNFLLEFNDRLHSKFIQEFGEDLNAENFNKLRVYAKYKKGELLYQSIREFYKALFMKGVYGPAYSKLCAIYTKEKMWDSLITLNKKLIGREDIKRFVDINKLLGNSYLNKKDKQKAIHYYQLAVSEEEEIFNKVAVTLQQQSYARNNVATGKLNTLLNGIKASLFETSAMIGKLYEELGEKENSNIYFNKAQNYR